MKKIILIDGNSLMFRSYYATAYKGTSNLMKNKEGVYTNAVFAFCNMFNKLVDSKIEYAFVAFDAGKKTFRHQQYDEYKAGRKPLPDELRMQIPLIKDFLDIIKVKRLESLDYEADDLIATCATLCKDEFDEILVVTGDKDLLQLVGGNVKVALTKKGVGDLEIYDEDNFYEKMSFYPNQLIDYKGIVGDTSDNLPGIKGIGEKTAIKLLNEYNSLENIYNNIDKLTGKAKTLFIENKETAEKCKYLATLELHADIDLKINDLRKGTPDISDLIAFYQKMDFHSMIKKLGVSSESSAEVHELKKDYSLSGISYIVMEMLGTNYYNNEYIGLGIINNNAEYFIKQSDVYNIKDYLEDEKSLKVVFDYKALYVQLKKQGITLKGVAFDMLISSYLINPAFASDDFKKVADNFNTNDLLYYDNIYGANSKMAIPSEAIYIDYALKKCKFLKDNYLNILKEIKDNNLDYLFNEEIKLSKVLGDMELVGLKIDVEHLKHIGNQLLEKAEKVEEEIYFIAGEKFNINSVKQLGEVLFEKLNLPHGKKNKTGYSTSGEVLEKLASKYVIAKDVLEYRAYMKIISTYVNGLIEVSKNSYIHPLYKQALTNTGRLSSVEPNIQNMPIRTEEGQVIREIFVSRFDNGQIISADYSQIELRVLAHISNDEKMINAFNKDVDFHTQTASEIYETDINNVTKEMRRNAKAINFGIIYGMSAWGLSEQINVTPLEANIFINKYFANYAKAKSCLDNFIKTAQEKGYSQTLYGRIRYIGELNSTNANLRNFGERTAMNSPIQGTAADIIKIAMNKVYDEMKLRSLKSLMIAQVHDELVFDCPEDEVEIMKKIVEEAMASAVKLSVPLAVGIASGKNWFEAK